MHQEQDGQHVNKTSSAVRITHIPTNIVVSCQSERSQIQNRETAMKMLKSKLLDLKEKEHKDRIEDLKGNQMDIAWGSQIRSYVFCPYTMVKDHRTNYEVGNIQSVMDGDLNGFILSSNQNITVAIEDNMKNYVLTFTNNYDNKILNSMKVEK